jgi:hypothetical protein
MPDRGLEPDGEQTPAHGRPDEQTPAEPGRRRGDEVFDDERSDRESGRPVQLEGDDEPEATGRDGGAKPDREAPAA